MICPSCSEQLPDTVKHCIHCGIAITRRSVQMAKIINNCGWVARRALGGFVAGGTGCLLSIAVSRATLVMDPSANISQDFSGLLKFFPGQMPFATAIAGCFIGTVGGMIERSAYKSFLGGILGAMGGSIGGFVYPLFEVLFKGQLYAYSFSMASTWCIVGAMVGLTSGLLEPARSKVLAGILGGLIGGGLGGGIGSQMYGAILMEIANVGKSPWMAGRLLEFVSGGIIGILVWFFLGFAEKLYIFRRRQLVESTKKLCDFCHGENALNAWYCAQCGSALQVAATREQIRVTPYRGLERVSNAFHFLSWLSATVGVVTAIVVFLSFLIQNFLFALFGAILVALVVYIISIIFKAMADIIKMGIQVSEKLTRENLQK